MIARTDQEITRIREAGACAAWVLDQVKRAVEPGVSTYDLDQIAKKFMEESGAVSSTYGYGRKGNEFPAYMCVSVNEQLVHGIGNKGKILKEGDIVSLDVALNYNGFVGDNTCTVGLGELVEPVKNLLTVTEQALQKGIEQAREGNRVGDISWAIQSFAEKNHLGVVRELVGHGVGREMHEEPQIPNFGAPHSGPLLHAGMVIAIEPMLTLGSPAIKTLSDGWTIVTQDGNYCAHFEHTVLITKDLPEILTSLKN